MRVILPNDSPLLDVFRTPGYSPKEADRLLVATDCFYDRYRKEPSIIKMNRNMRNALLEETNPRIPIEIDDGLSDFEFVVGDN